MTDGAGTDGAGTDGAVTDCAGTSDAQEDTAAPLTPEALLDLLRTLGIDASTHHHAPVFTVEESRALKGHLPGAHTKNLFLRDKKGRMWLVVALYDRPVNLLALGRRLETRGRLSFGSPERLLRTLGVTPGAVTPFGAVNDRKGEVTIALDTGLRQYDLWNSHPLDNAMTTTIRADDMMRFLRETGHEPIWVELADPRREDAPAP